jgi:mevalonate kinase
LAARGFAPGKLILSGEHAVVYGYRAVAAAVSRGTTVTLVDRPGPSGLDDALMDDGGAIADARQRATNHVGRTGYGRYGRADRSGGRLAEVRATVATVPGAADARLWPALATIVPADGIGVRITSDLPIGCGMGSSAALAVATVRALAAREGREAGFDECFELGFRIERVFHGTPSGIDHTVSARGGAVLYRKAGPEIAPLPLSRPLMLVVANTGTPGDTAAMVAGVRTRGCDAELRRIGAVAEMVAAHLQRGEDPGPLFSENHRLLRRIGVSTPALDEVCRAMEAAGATGAKLAGAGGGGVAIAVVTEDTRDAATTAARACGCDALDVTVAPSVG